jgi:hypothetical protein
VKVLPLLFVLGACRTLPVVEPFALAPVDAPVLGRDLVVLPVACGEGVSPPSFWGAEWDVSSHACVPALADHVAEIVDTELAAKGFRVARGTQPLERFEELAPDERQSTFDQLHASGIVRVAVSTWREIGARVTIVVATRDRPFARIATCESHMFSNAGAQIIQADRSEIVANAARCATARLPDRAGTVPPPVAPSEDGRP